MFNQPKRQYKTAYRYFVKGHYSLVNATHAVLTTDFKFKLPEDIKNLDQIIFFKEKHEADAVAQELSIMYNGLKTWSVIASTSNFDQLNLIRNEQNIYEYITLRNPDDKYEQTILNKYSYILKKPKEAFNMLQTINFVIIDGLEKYKQLYSEHVFDFHRGITRDELVEVVIKNSKNTTVLRFLNQNGKFEVVKVQYDGSVHDKGFSNELGFLFAFYKYQHRDFNSEGLQKKLELVLNNLTKQERRIYLRSYFLESNLLSINQANKLLKKIRFHDLELVDKTITLEKGIIKNETVKKLEY